VSDSYFPLGFEIVFVSPTGTKSLPSHEHLVSIELELPSKGCWRGTVELFDPTGDFLESLALGVGLKSFIKMQFGERGAASLGPWFIGGILTITPDFRPEGVGLTLEVVSKAGHTQVADVRERSFPANTDPAEIVRAIAKDRGWKTVDAQGRATVESPSKMLAHAVQTTGESDIAFLLKQVLPHSVDANGNHFRFGVSHDDPAVVSFVSVVSAQFRVSRKTYTYLRDPHGEVRRFAPTDNTFAGWLLGAGQSELLGVDSAEGTGTVKDASAEGGTQGAQSTLAGAAYVTPAIGVSRRVLLPGRNTQDVATAAAHLWTKFAEISYSAELEVKGTHDVLAGEFLTVNYYRRDGSAHPMGGMFRVLKVRHQFGMDGWITTFDLVRNGSQYTPDKTQQATREIINLDQRDPPDVATNATINAGTGVPRGPA
jgi:hypothetical protein